MVVADDRPQPLRRRVFQIPDGFVFLRGRCPRCHGNVCAEDSEIRCFMCGVELQVEVVTIHGCPLRYRVDSRTVPLVTRIGRHEQTWAHRSVARDMGLTGRAARMLRYVPTAPGKIGISKLAKTMNITNAQAREAIGTLVRQGLIIRIEYGDGHAYVGYQQKVRP